MIVFALISLVPVLLMAYSSIHLATEAVRRQAQDGIRNTSSVSALLVAQEMEGLAQLVDSYADRPFMIEAMQKGDRRALVSQLQELLDREGIRSAFVADPTGRLIDIRPATPEIVGDDFSFRDWYRGVTESGTAYISDAYESALRGHPRVVAAAAPIEAVTGGGSGRELIGIVVAAYDIEAIQGLAKEFARSQGVALTVTDQRGTIVAGPGAAPSALVSLRSEPDVQEALRGRSGIVEVESSGGRRIHAFAPVPSLGWTVSVGIPLDQALRGAATLRSTVLIISTVLVLIVGAVLTVLVIALRQRARAEKELKESETRIRSIIEAATEAFVSIDERGVITGWNDKAHTMFGWSRDEVLGRTVADVIVPPESREAHTHGITRFLETGEGPLLGQRVEIEALHRDGNRIPVELVAWPVKTDDRWTFNAFVADISERKRIEQEIARAHEEALEASRHKSEFLANMSHEIRTPMNAVIGMTGLLLRTELTDEQRDYAETVRSSGDALLTLINDILDYSKIEAGKMQLEAIDFDLRTVIEEVGDLLAEQAQVKALELAVLVKPTVPAVVCGDPGRIRQVLVNLVSNAIKFTEAGEVVVCADVVDESKNELVVRLEVIDTGIGLSADRKDHIFSSFTQADASSTRRYGGTGLGLAISKQLTEMMGGDIGVESEPGAGSTFWFTVRLRHGSVEYLQPFRKRATLHGLRALVVDDNATNRAILTENLKAWEMTPVTAGSGPEALELLREAAGKGRTFDVAILDFHMPDMDGLQLARAIRDDATIGGVRLLLLTSAGNRGDARKAQEAGIEAYLTKPVRPSSLYDCLATVAGMERGGGWSSLITRHTLADMKAQTRAHILVAEDNAVNQKVARRMLEKLEYRVDLVSDGVEAVDAVARISYAAVLMDCQMPEMDGFEASRRIRALESPKGSVPIIAMTAGAMEGDRERCLAAGMNDYMAKPVKLEELAAVLDRWVESEDTNDDSPAGRGQDFPSSLNMAKLSSLMELENEPGELVREFLGDADDKIRVLQDSIARRDLAGAGDAAHTLKSAAGTLGAETLAMMCDSAQRIAATGSIEELAPLVNAMKEEYETAIATLRAELALLVD
ncbi:MAG: response regulator [Actinomycetota bacterium]